MNILTQSTAITDSMTEQHYIALANFEKKNVITFDLTEIERNKRYVVSMKFCCASNGGIKNVKIARKNQLLSQNIFDKIAIFLKSTDL